MFMQSSRQKFAPANVPPGSPRQSTGGMMKGGGAPASGGGGKGGGRPTVGMGPSIQNMGGDFSGPQAQAISPPSGPSPTLGSGQAGYSQYAPQPVSAQSMMSAALGGFQQPTLPSGGPNTAIQQSGPTGLQGQSFSGLMGPGRDTILNAIQRPAPTPQQQAPAIPEGLMRRLQSFGRF